MHSLSASFVLGYHGCTESVGRRLLDGAPFEQSENEYDWLGSGVYFWEANPDRALDWARETIARRKSSSPEKAFVVGASISLGFCLDLISTNGIREVKQAYNNLVAAAATAKVALPKNRGGKDLLLRSLDRAVIESLHVSRERLHEQTFDTVRALFPEAAPLYENSGFQEKTHIQICVRNQDCIKGVFRVPAHHLSKV